MSKHNPQRSRRSRRKAGAILIWFVLLLPLLLGMTGLVIDAGLLMASHRHLQNSVDAAALAGAEDLLTGLGWPEAEATAKNFVRTHHGLEHAKLDINSPPEQGVYAGEQDFVEVIVEQETPTIFIQLLDPTRLSRKATARAVAGPDTAPIVDGVFALDHRKSPGLTVTGNARLSASGRVVVNSEGGGFGSDGSRLGGLQRGFGAFVSPFAEVRADEFHLVGGVNRTDRFQSFSGSSQSPLKTGQLPIPDPLSHLPVPSVEFGVINVQRGIATATPTHMTVSNTTDENAVPNQVITDPDTGEQTMVLHPGIYTSIDITGGKVIFHPGIYVVAAPITSMYAVRILDGEIEADGVMFYNTSDRYDPVTGQPDVSDAFLPESTGADKRQIRINAALGFSGIDTTTYDYGDARSQISLYDGVLIFQRRSIIATIQIQGFVQDRVFKGAIYAKWAGLRLPAGGTLNSQVVVGTIAVPGHGDLHIKYDDADKVRSIEVYLVE